MASWFNWNLLAAIFTVIGALATVVAVVLAVWSLWISKQGAGRSKLRVQLGPLPLQWDNLEIVYGLVPERALVAVLPLVVRNHSKHAAAHGITFEVVVPALANLLYKSGNTSIAAELQKGILPGLEARITVVGEFVHLYWWIPAMNPQTTALLPIPFVCSQTEITRDVFVETKDGVSGNMRVKASFALVFNAIIHCNDSPPSVRTFEVLAYQAPDLKTLVDISVKGGLFASSDQDRRRLWERVLLRNKKVMFVLPAAEPWSQDGIQIFAEDQSGPVPTYREIFEKSQRWLFTGYCGLSRLRRVRWSFH